MKICVIACTHKKRINHLIIVDEFICKNFFYHCSSLFLHFFVCYFTVCFGDISDDYTQITRMVETNILKSESKYFDTKVHPDEAIERGRVRKGF